MPMCLVKKSLRKRLTLGRHRMMVRLLGFDIVRETWCGLAERIFVAVSFVLGLGYADEEPVDFFVEVNLICWIRCCGELGLQAQHVKDKAKVYDHANAMERQPYEA